MCQSWRQQLKIVRNFEAMLDTSQTNARSAAASKGWMLGGVTIPYERVCDRVMGTIVSLQITRPVWRLSIPRYLSASD
jgi:hypothetical protein